MVTQGMPPHSSGFCLHPGGGTVRGATWVSRPGTTAGGRCPGQAWRTHSLGSSCSTPAAFCLLLAAPVGRSHTTGLSLDPAPLVDPYPLTPDPSLRAALHSGLVESQALAGAVLPVPGLGDPRDLAVARAALATSGFLGQEWAGSPGVQPPLRQPHSWGGGSRDPLVPGQAFCQCLPSPPLVRTPGVCWVLPGLQPDASSSQGGSETHLPGQAPFLVLT